MVRGSDGTEQPGQPVGHPWQEWDWDETVFAGTAAYYRRGRYPYAPGLPDVLARRFHLDGAGRLLDIGCGPGSVTVLLAHLFQRVVGVDADEGMVGEARRAADEAHVLNAEWVHMRAEELPGDLGTFRIITLAQSFHWMDRTRVATATRQMLDPGGAVVHIDQKHSPPSERSAGPSPPVPEKSWKRCG